MKRYLAITLVIVASLSLIGCGKKKVEEPEQSIAVTVQSVDSGEIKNTNTFVGTTKAKEETNVSVEIGGTVETVNVEVGQEVRKGDVLLKIKGDDVQTGLNTARAALESAQANSESNVEQTRIQMESALNNAQLAYDEAKRNFEIQTELYNADAISEDTYKKVENAYNSAKQGLDAAIKNYNDLLPKVEKGGQASVAQAQASYDSAARNIEKLKLTAPVDGIVTEKKCNANEVIQQGSPAFVISNTDIMQIDLYITGSDIDKFKVGETVDIKIQGEKTTGTIQTVPVATSSTNSLYTVEVVFNNNNNKFKSGMAAEVDISINKSENSISIPSKAIVEDGDKKYVYIVTEDKKAKKVEVTTGIETTDNIEIKSGVTDKDTVVVGGLSLIGDGSKLFPVEKKED